MAGLASDWLRHFLLLLWTEFNETSQEARSQSPLPILCFSCGSEKQDGNPCLLFGWDSFDFSETAERNSTKLDRKQDLNVLYQVCVFSGRSEKQNGRPGLWLAETFLTYSSEQNSTKLDGKQDFNVLYHVCVVQVDRDKMAILASYKLRLLLLNCWTEFKETWQEARFQHPLQSFCFSGRSEKQDGCPGLWLRHFRLLWKPLNGI